MPRRKLIILANSERDGARCIAGIDPDTGEWIRPVSCDPKRAITSSITKSVEVMGIWEIPLMVLRPYPYDKFQKENWFVESWEWRALGQASLDEVLPYCENTPLILHSSTDRVAPADLEKLPYEQWKSLQLVHVKTTFEPDQAPWNRGKGKWRAGFEDGSGNSLALSVTDDRIERRLNEGEKLDGDCLLTISLGVPYTAPSQPERCYKLVAGVIQVPGG